MQYIVTIWLLSILEIYISLDCRGVTKERRKCSNRETREGYVGIRQTREVTGQTDDVVHETVCFFELPGFIELHEYF